MNFSTPQLHSSDNARRPGPAVRPRAFTLIELLTVIAIIGILAGILIPTVSGVRNSARRAETKVRFAQWAAAMQQFRQEYGYYPLIDGGGTPNKINPVRFAGALTGRRFDGTVFGSTTDADLAGNKRQIAFYSLSENELSADRTALIDAFGNTDFAVYYDRDEDGRITVADAASGTPAAVTGASGNLQPTSAEINLAADKGVRASVIFYSAGKGAHDGDIIFSWK